MMAGAANSYVTASNSRLRQILARSAKDDSFDSICNVGVQNAKGGRGACAVCGTIGRSDLRS